MITAKVTTGGRITIPAHVRFAMKAKPGDQIDFVEVAPHQFQLRVIRSSKRLTNSSANGKVSSQ